MDVYNTHLKNLVDAYAEKNVEVILGYDSFVYSNIKPDVIHFHMPEGILNFINYNVELFFERMEYFSRNGVKMIYTVHDLLPLSQKANFDYYTFFNRFFSFITLFIHHGQRSIGIFKAKFIETAIKTHIVCNHGDYLKDMSLFSDDFDSARNALSIPISKKVFLVFGQLQHKNTDFVYKVFSLLRKTNKDVFLILAGVNPKYKYNGLNQFYYRVNNKIFNRFRKNSLVLNKRFSNHEMYILFKASNLVFLSHNYGMTSGLIPMSATLSKPFVYPKIGCFEDQAEFCLAESYKAKNTSEAIAAINKVLSKSNLNFDNSAWISNNSWEEHVNRILRELLHNDKPLSK